MSKLINKVVFSNNYNIVNEFNGGDFSYEIGKRIITIKRNSFIGKMISNRIKNMF